MKNLKSIFEIVRKYCFERGVSNEQCFKELEKMTVNNSIFFPLFSYLRVLQSLGLIKLSKLRKEIILTEKGRVADDSEFSSKAYLILFLHFLRRIFLVTFLFTLFWPMFLFIHKQMITGRINEEGHVRQ